MVPILNMQMIGSAETKPISAKCMMVKWVLQFLKSIFFFRHCLVCIHLHSENEPAKFVDNVKDNFVIEKKLIVPNISADLLMYEIVDSSLSETN